MTLQAQIKPPASAGGFLPSAETASVAVMRLVLAIAAALLAATPTLAQPPQRTVAVTFDDLPYQASPSDLCDPARIEAMTRDFLAMLRPLDTHAIGFVNEGQLCPEIRPTALPEMLDAWLDAGLDLGNHTYSHPTFQQIGLGAYLDEVDRGAPTTRRLLAERGRDLIWFRHPFLNTGDTEETTRGLAEGLAARGYRVAPVTLDNSDWMFATVYRAAEERGDAALMRRIGEAYVAHMTAALDHAEPYSAALNGGREPAQVLLLHVNSLNRDWYPAVHRLFRDRGYRFVPLDQAMADPIYARANTVARPEGYVWLQRWAMTDGLEPSWGPEPPEWIRTAYAAVMAAAAAGEAEAAAMAKPPAP